MKTKIIHFSLSFQKNGQIPCCISNSKKGAEKSWADEECKAGCRFITFGCET
jgi:hypothetical protein